MAKVTAAQKNQCAEHQKYYKTKIEEYKKKIRTLEGSLTTVDEDSFPKKLDIAFLSLVEASYHCALNTVSFDMLGIKMEAEMNTARKLLVKVMLLCEDVYGKETDMPLLYNEEAHAIVEEKYNDKWKYDFISTVGYMIDYLEDFYGDNSKWKWNFAELEGRLALLAKNMINFKTFIRTWEPGTEFYAERCNHMKIVKKLLQENADAYKLKYELTDKNIDDIRFAISLSSTLRMVYVYLGEMDNVSKQKKITDLWAKKMNDDLKKSK